MLDYLPPQRRTVFSILVGRRASSPAGSPGPRGLGGGSGSKGRCIDQQRLCWKLIVFVNAQREALKFLGEVLKFSCSSSSLVFETLIKRLLSGTWKAPAFS